jgi:hypothetical protein
MSAALKHFYGKLLSDEGRRLAYPPIDLKKLEDDAEPGAVDHPKFTDADMIKYIVYLIGDIHQPLHVGFKSDDSGGQISVQYRGSSVSLYSIWDTLITQRLQEEDASWWWGGWTHISHAQGTFEAEKRAWSQDGAFARIEAWLEESRELACDIAYRDPLTKEPLQNNGVEVTDEAYAILREKITKQMLVAGARLAVLLNDLLDARGAQKLEAGSAVVVEGYEEDPAYRATRKVDYSGAGKNFMILLMLAGLFYFATSMDGATLGTKGSFSSATKAGLDMKAK